MNTVIVCLNQKVEFVSHNPYTIDMDRRSQNCYNCGIFGHLTRNCKNRGTENRNGKGRRLEYCYEMLEH